MEYINAHLIYMDGLLWSRRRARKAGVCAMTSKAFEVGALVFGPLTNKTGRHRRISAEWVKNHPSAS